MQAGTRIGNRYTLTYPVGRGGSGEVWAGHDDTLHRPVAVKLLRQPEADDDDRRIAVDRFMREAQVVARLDHPGVPAVHDLGVQDGAIYIVMQLVPGLVLADLIAEHSPLSATWTAAIGAQICSVLAAAHHASLVHRDLKPQNVMITPTGVVKVLDFGVAALLDPGVPRLTITGQILGTPAYIAPEQALGDAVDPRTDLYALGCVLFELLTGVLPYPADSTAEMLHRHVAEPIPLLSDHRTDLPSGLGRLVAQLLAKKPANRPESAVAVYEQLVRFATPATGPREDPLVLMPDGGHIDPMMPYLHPFGPLPLLDGKD
jgi:eukaryotic-like serine/threonine-protein kinase